MRCEVCLACCMSKKRFDLLNHAQWELIEPQLPALKLRKDKRGASVDVRSCVSGRHPLNFADGCSEAFFARHVSFYGDVLAAVEAVGRARRVAGRMASASGIFG